MAKILIVDDSAFARNRLQLVIQGGGHKVVGHAMNGQQALEQYRELKPDLVTLDYLMPGMNGEEVLLELIKLDPSAKVVVISGSGDHSIKTKVLKAGAKEFVEKPSMQVEILKVLDLVMEA
jgi:two-component system chemotaxis response regulator CheY